MKSCFKCGEVKPLTEYYKHGQMKDGHLNKCKTCAKKDVHTHRHDSPSRAKILAYDVLRGNRQSIEYRNKYKAEYPKKYKAHCMINNAVRNKKLFREPCEICGKENTHGHHDDYDKPLNVRWLCAEHHRQWHAKHGEALNAF